MELVSLGGARNDGTLGNTGHTVHVVGANLSDTVPMDGCSIVLELVVNRDFDYIALLEVRSGFKAVWTYLPSCIR